MRCLDVGRAEHLDVLDDVVDVAVAADQAEDALADLVAPRRPTSRRPARTARTARTRDIVCLPGGATVGSYAVWKYSSAKPGDGIAARAVLERLLGVVDRHGDRHRRAGSASRRRERVQRGSRDSPQLTFTTGLVVRHAADPRRRTPASIGVAEQAGR